MRILVVEDEAFLRAQLEQTLRGAGFVVEGCDDGWLAEKLGLTETWDAVVLDLGLPGHDGISVLKRWREEGIAVPVLILTARSRFSEKMAGFAAGADDYLTKPFEAEEVVVRLRALIRRAAGHASSTLSCGPVVLDTAGGRVTANGQPLHLTAQEFRILSYMMHHQGRVISRSTLMAHVYDHAVNRESNVVDVLLSRIRRKLPVNIIQTVRGQGYRLALPNA
ncbi:response regulator transcription factor [Caenispirillum bisanense]|uniref:Two-component system, OmpR family, response regulator n=1 Tax=Caenispirillum bisanense TaxID=414052 RepID=A0A286G105_9PROT|nr:response regulator transcription factor [Caenispirillum bisanense]SOD89227.1 two-component system, OmpR family, response regulator [Caenispirillum bisanense]